MFNWGSMAPTVEYDIVCAELDVFDANRPTMEPAVSTSELWKTRNTPEPVQPSVFVRSSTLYAFELPSYSPLSFFFEPLNSVLNHDVIADNALSESSSSSPVDSPSMSAAWAFCQ